MGLTTVFDTIKMAKEFAQKFIKNELIGKLGEALDKLYHFRDDKLQLQEENTTLKTNLEKYDNWEKRLKKYRLVERSNVYIYESMDSNPTHYICPSCADNKKEIHVLQLQQKCDMPHRCP